MDHAILLAFLGGLTAMGYLVAGVFFFKFWRQSRDPLFLAFAAAFGLMGANQAIIVLVLGDQESQGEAYLLRLAAFVLIVAAILRKNITKSGPRSG
ncbi:MAG TPA: DUF5985 family protein [Caulobacteraceae bacterium]|jgi:O-antigen/teichoic acid export membrane protein